MKTIRQLIKKGDPKLHAQIPKALKGIIYQSAKQAKRKPQDEIIKRLTATFKHEDAYLRLQELLKKS